MENFIFGGFAEGFNVWRTIITTIEYYKFIVRDNVRIRALFDNFGACSWNGGGLSLCKVYKEVDVKDISAFYNSRGIPIRLTMTNPTLEKRDLYDRYANMILTTCENDINEVLVSSELVEEYIRNKYPKYKICRSIIASEKIPYDVNNYEMTVMARRYNNNWEFLDKIPFEIRDKIEFLCNEWCIENCPRAYEHYRESGNCQKNFTNSSIGAYCSFAEERGPFAHYSLTNNKDRHTYISPNAIFNDYSPKGFHNFKLANRNDMERTIEYFAEYMIRPEYQFDFRTIIHDQSKLGQIFFQNIG